MDLDNYSFYDLLVDLTTKIKGLKRLRISSIEMSQVSDEIIELIGRSPIIVDHLHIPIQSGTDSILRRMARHYNTAEFEKKYFELKEALPGISITTDVIVGFPGETEEDFKETLDVVREVGFDSAYTYVYSKRSGTPAASMEDQVDKDVIKDRFDRLLALLKETSAKNCKKKVGDIERVLIEEENTHEEGMLTGRLENNLLVHFKGCKEQIGTMADVKLVEEKGFYYMGEQIHG